MFAVFACLAGEFAQLFIIKDTMIDM
jgi:hypothetical protein